MSRAISTIIFNYNAGPLLRGLPRQENILWMMMDGASTGQYSIGANWFTALETRLTVGIVLCPLLSNWPSFSDYFALLDNKVATLLHLMYA